MKKITGNISLTLTAVVDEVSFTPQGHAKHKLGYVKVVDGDETKFTNWQYLVFAKDGQETKTYQVGTVLRLTFKSFTIFTSQTGGVYLSPDGYVDVDVVKWGDKEQGDTSTQPTSYNKPNPPTATSDEFEF